jgi:hypothetical protein
MTCRAGKTVTTEASAVALRLLIVIGVCFNRGHIRRNLATPLIKSIRPHDRPATMWQNGTQAAMLQERALQQHSE